MNLIVAREDNEGDPRIAQWMASYHTEEVHQAALGSFNGGVVKGW